MGYWPATTPTWTTYLDALAVLLLGYEVSEELPKLHNHERKVLSVLDTASGTIGDAAGGAEVGVLALGAEGPLVRKRTYKI